MSVGEATRQYQATLEAQRRTRTMFAGVTSAEDELAHAAAETDAADREMCRVWWLAHEGRDRP